MSTVAPRLAFIDALKGVASQLVVLHHLAFYGPMSDVARDLAPALLAWLSQDARIAVQIFLVIGGFLAAKALAPAGQLLTATPLSMLKKRYFKLVIPYVAAVLLCLVCAAIARRLIDHDSIPEAPTLLQMLAHIALLQSLLDFDSLSAGVWYIAIDFQLFALTLGLLWLARSSGKRRNAVPVIGFLLVASVALASLFHFNRNAGWDSWAIYFFGSYGLGALTYWASSKEPTEHQTDWLLLIAGAVCLALIVDFRSRIALALVTALALGLSRRWGFLENRPKSSLLAYLGKISYSVFLVHFPVIIVVNAVFTRISPDSPAVNAFGFVFAWLCSIAAGSLFYRYVECRTGQWQKVTQAPVMLLRNIFSPALHTKS
jgi:peptidoglycan/LPS O-acetylase OafA/YrhL